ncbi:HPr family phosphocarrier protein [Desulfobacula toluolica]|uniref:PtsH: phosphocarrier protein HPr n=1 Tax=Desulfobacula toluolica (strain DSM 7467 / Tol2) TaxID=651182 RepID=K0N6J9_DESTT|nr:HPr family phosphocarrier protein [Desulfobacula toluolica]CCK79614.1 PtsH: phosphocarrier protein HPr [Desulfobacula toluolica Tol2]
MKNSEIITRKTLVKNELGMHARPASKIAQMAELAQSDIWLCANSTKVDATSIIDILTLCAVKGTRIVIEIENQEDMVILDRIVDFFETGFGEI